MSPQVRDLTIPHPHSLCSCYCITSNRFFLTRSRSHDCINAPQFKLDSSTHDGSPYTFQSTLNCLCTLPHMCQFPSVLLLHAIQKYPDLQSAAYVQQIAIMIMLFSAILDCFRQSTVYHRSHPLIMALYAKTPSLWISSSRRGNPYR